MAAEGAAGPWREQSFSTHSNEELNSRFTVINCAGENEEFPFFSPAKGTRFRYLSGFQGRRTKATTAVMENIR